VGFEPTIPVFERAKTVHALDHTATVIGTYNYEACVIKYRSKKLCDEMELQILNLGTKWRDAHIQEKVLWYPLDRRS
jgi:hypothetical protein